MVNTKNIQRPDTFRQWFDNSQIMDNTGAPRVVYHGTYAHVTFEAFDTRRNKALDRLGAYFTHCPEAAGRIRGGMKQIIPVFLKIRKPLDLRGVKREDVAALTGFNEAIQREMWYQGRAGIYATLEWLDRQYDLVPKLKRKGYDGIIFDADHEGTTFVVFSPTQIKSIYNCGAWSLNDPALLA